MTAHQTEPWNGTETDPGPFDIFRRACIDILVGDDKLSPDAAASKLGVTRRQVKQDLYALGYGPTGIRRKDKANSQRRERNDRKRAKVGAARDRRRFMEASVPTGHVNRVAAAGVKGTIFPDSVKNFPHRDEKILKDGALNAKIGGDVLVGRLKGARIYTLTLEERATCPTDCLLWRECYGNSMDARTRRWKLDPALMRSIAAEVAALCEKHDTVLIRLHVLGDFKTFAYLKSWAELLDRHEGLHVFGFTAWKRGTEIGDGVARLRDAYPDRFCMRHSDGTAQDWSSFTLDFATQEKTVGGAVVCPEQRDVIDAPWRGTHCGSCGLCWAGATSIAFIRH